jgi:hypothetical protein
LEYSYKVFAAAAYDECPDNASPTAMLPFPYTERLIIREAACLVAINRVYTGQSTSGKSLAWISWTYTVLTTHIHD